MSIKWLIFEHKNIKRKNHHLFVLFYNEFFIFMLYVDFIIVVKKCRCIFHFSLVNHLYNFLFLCFLERIFLSIFCVIVMALKYMNWNGAQMKFTVSVRAKMRPMTHLSFCHSTAKFVRVCVCVWLCVLRICPCTRLTANSSFAHRFRFRPCCW